MKIFIPILRKTLFMFPNDFRFGEHPTRVNLIHTDTFFAMQCIVQVSDYRHECSFRHTVRQQVGFTAVGVYRTDVEYTAMCFSEKRQRGLDQRKGGYCIHLYHLPEEGQVGSMNIGGNYHSCIVDYGIQFSKCLDGTIDETLRSAIGSDVFDEQTCLVLTDLCQHLFTQGLFQSMKNNRCPLSHTPNGNGFPYSRRTPCDDDDFTL